MPNVRKQMAVRLVADGDNPFRITLENPTNMTIKIGQVIPAGLLMLVAHGGTGPYAFEPTSIGDTSGSSGLAVGADGQITGTATDVGTFGFIGECQDADGEIFLGSFEVTVQHVLQWEQVSPPQQSEVGLDYFYQFRASGGTGTTSYSIVWDFTTPSWITLDADGNFSGIPVSSAPIAATYTVTASDSGSGDSITYHGALVTAAHVALNPVTGVLMPVSSNFRGVVVDVGLTTGVAPYVYRVDQTTLPAGVVGGMTASGRFGVINLTSSENPFTGIINIFVTDSLGATASNSIDITTYIPNQQIGAGDGTTTVINPSALVFDPTTFTVTDDGSGGLHVSSVAGATPWLMYDYVSDFGADPTGATDSDTAWAALKAQAETNAAASLSTSVWMGNNAHYKYSGALSGGAVNAQLELPSVNNSSGEQVTLRLVGGISGQTAICLVGSTPLPDSGVIHESLLSAGSGYFINGGNSGTFTCLNLVIENMQFRMQPNPTNSCFGPGMNCERIENVSIDAGSYIASSLTQPTHSSSFAICSPAVNNGAYSVYRNVLVVGFYNGFQCNEHTILEGSCSAWACKNAMVVQTVNHAMYAGRFMDIWCQNGIVTNGSNAAVSIAQYDIERYTTAGHWYTRVYDINDPTNDLNGDIRWWAVEAGVGPTATFAVNGAAGSQLNYAQIGTSSGGGGTTLKHSRTKWTASAGNNTFTLNSSPYTSSDSTVEIVQQQTISSVPLVENNLFPEGATITGTGVTYTQSPPFAGGETGYVEYWYSTGSGGISLTTGAGPGFYATLATINGGPTSWYKLDEASGDFIDQSGNGLDLSPGASGLTRAQATLLPSESGSACVSSSGANAIGERAVGQWTSYGTTAIGSMLCVVDITIPGSYCGFMRSGNNANPLQQGWMFAATSSGQLAFQSYDGGFQVDLTSAGVLTAGLHMIGVAVDGGAGTISYMVDGSIVHTTTGWSHGLSASTISGFLAIGADIPSAGQFTGKMQAAAIWDGYATNSTDWTNLQASR